MKRTVRRLLAALSIAALPACLLCTGAPSNAQTANSTQSGDAESLAILTPDVDSRMVSPENPTGEKGKGAMRTPDPTDPDLAFSRAASDLGRGWKVRPFIKVPAHSTVTIMDVSGPGTIKHIWMAATEDLHGVGRAGILRFYWDD
jgi:hypothetical protein